MHTIFVGACRLEALVRNNMAMARVSSLLRGVLLLLCCSSSLLVVLLKQSVGSLTHSQRPSLSIPPLSVSMSGLALLALLHTVLLFIASEQLELDTTPMAKHCLH